MSAGQPAAVTDVSALSSWELYEAVHRFLCREGDALDQQRWDDWLALFADDVEYWVPAWDSEFDLTQDPKREVSLIYIRSKTEIGDRLWRFTSGQSAASVPLPRTVHHLTNVELVGVAADQVQVRAKWFTHAYRFRESQFFGGHSEYTLRRQADGFLIQRKKSVLVNDRPVATVDLYHF